MNKAIGRNVGIIIILISIISFLILYIFYRENQMVQVVQNDYNKSFYELITYVDNVENMLSKAMISNTNEYTAQNLVNVWREANLAQKTITDIPINVNTLENTNKYLNQVSDYAYAMSKNCINGNSLTDKQKDEISTIYNYSGKIKEQLINTANDLQNGDFTWNDITRTGNKMFNQNYDAVQVSFVDNMNNDLQKYAGLIYDGAFSNHILQQEPKGLGDKEFTKEKSKEIVYDFIEKENISSIDYVGMSNGRIPTYDYNVNMKNGKDIILMSITKVGGKLLYMIYTRDVDEKKLSIDEGKEKGKEFLEKVGYNNMVATYHMNEGNSIIVNYAYSLDSIIIYPDLIKLKIALDNGEVLGVEANGYVYNHYERVIEKNIISLDEAAENINKSIEVTSQGLSIIPTDWKTEILCYEFKGKMNDQNVIVYINAITGKEENILIVLDDVNGVLTI